MRLRLPWQWTGAKLCSVCYAFKASSALAPRGVQDRCRPPWAPPGAQLCPAHGIAEHEHMFFFLPRARVSGVMAPSPGEF